MNGDGPSAEDGQCATGGHGFGAGSAGGTVYLYDDSHKTGASGIVYVEWPVEPEKCPSEQLRKFPMSVALISKLIFIASC